MHGCGHPLHFTGTRQRLAVADLCQANVMAPSRRRKLVVTSKKANVFRSLFYDVSGGRCRLVAHFLRNQIFNFPLNMLHSAVKILGN